CTSTRAQFPDTGTDASAHLRCRCEDAFVHGNWGDGPGARRRLELELGLIARRGLAGLFLLVAGGAAESRRRGWPMARRGSAGAALVCYLLGVTALDPLRYGLRVELQIPSPLVAAGHGPARPSPVLGPLPAWGAPAATASSAASTRWASG